jgi:hypothetical protein
MSDIIQSEQVENLIIAIRGENAKYPPKAFTEKIGGRYAK